MIKSNPAVLFVCVLLCLLSCWPPSHSLGDRRLVRPVCRHCHHRDGNVLLHETAGEPACSKVGVARRRLFWNLHGGAKRRRRDPRWKTWPAKKNTENERKWGKKKTLSPCLLIFLCSDLCIYQSMPNKNQFYIFSCIFLYPNLLVLLLHCAQIILSWIFGSTAPFQS